MKHPRRMPIYALKGRQTGSVPRLVLCISFADEREGKASFTRKAAPAPQRQYVNWSRKMASSACWIPRCCTANAIQGFLWFARAAFRSPVWEVTHLRDYGGPAVIATSAIRLFGDTATATDAIPYLKGPQTPKPPWSLYYLYCSGYPGLTANPPS